MKKIFETQTQSVPSAVLVAVTNQNQTIEKTKEYLDELSFLAETLGIKEKKRFTQNLDKINPKTFVGKGKLEEIAEFVEVNDIDMVIFDDDLSTSHVKNLELILKDCMVIDRSLLILQIFMKRAQTAQAKLQVELAQYEYMLPRLINLWTHHSRQKGGIGMKGPGETELETDKRIIRDKISLLKEKLKKIDQQNTIRRESRKKMVRVALVGYTNVGKSTLMNVLSKGKADAFAEDKLFATVDSKVRKMTLSNIPFLLSDTVGFIRKLPTTLIESFKSTLDEVKEADILLHVVDISNENFEDQIEVVNKTLGEIGAANKKTILVFNKTDAFKAKEFPPFEDHPPNSIEEWTSFYSNKKAVFISAYKNTNISYLKETLLEEVEKVYYAIFPNHKKFSYNQFWKDSES